NRSQPNPEVETVNRITELRRIHGRNYFAARVIINDDDVFAYDIGSLSISCQFCDAIHFNKEKIGNHFKSCCHNGKVILPISKRIRSPNPEIERLLKDNSADAKNYRQNIRKYNAALAFASMNAKIVELSNRGPYVYKIHGQVYHTDP
ncbi:hypothetical protein B4U80_11394, partial [Leptotrombidium deliense]